MTSTATTRNRLEKQGTGDNSNTWGTYLNSSIDLIDAALDGRTAFSLSGAKTLTSVNYGADESRERFLDITGGTGGTVTIPAVEKWYIVRNNSSGDAVFTTGSGVTQTVKPGSITLIVSDGTNIRAGVDKYYVDNLVEQTAFATAVPNQSGNSGKYLTTNGTVASWSPVLSLAEASDLSLTTGVTGTLPVANGGTNSTGTPTAGGITYGTGTAYAFTSAGAAGQVLTSNGTSAPTWGSVVGSLGEVDRWYVSTTQGDPATATELSIYTWSRSSYYFSKVGTGMSVSTQTLNSPIYGSMEMGGVFMFPSTGTWEIDVRLTLNYTGPDSQTVRILYATDGLNLNSVETISPSDRTRLILTVTNTANNKLVITRKGQVVTGQTGSYIAFKKLT